MKYPEYLQLGLPLAPKDYSKAGIYCLFNTLNSHKYVGQSYNLGARRREHFRALRNNKHYNKYLQNAYNKYGGTFIFIVLEFVGINNLSDKEQYWIERLKPEYNIVQNVFDGMPHLNNRGGQPDEEIIIKQTQGDEFIRPDWHAWVYGGARNPVLDKG